MGSPAGYYLTAAGIGTLGLVDGDTLELSNLQRQIAHTAADLGRPKIDVIVMATPLYFFGASAQLNLIFDRMFSLYKWDNTAGTMETP